MATQKEKKKVQESEAERLLRKARELRAEAEAAQDALHTSNLEKKKHKDEETDSVIDFLFPDGNLGLIFDRLLSDKRPSTDMLLRVVTRLHEREVVAKGFSHVERSQHHSHTKFEVVKDNADEVELARVSGFIELLLSAAAAVDEAVNMNRTERHHASDSHFTEGSLAPILNAKVKDLRREHDEQFQERLKEYYEAARKKDRDSDKKLFTKEDLDWDPPKP